MTDPVHWSHIGSMKRTLYALVPWMVLAAAAPAQVRQADVAYAHANAIPTRAFRLGDECFVPIDGVGAWGWRVDVRGDRGEIRAEGKTINVTLRRMDGRPSIPLTKVVRELNAECRWVSGMDTLEIWSPLKEVTFRRGRLTYNGPLSVSRNAFLLTDPNRIVVDLTGTRLTDDTKLDVDDGVRVTQYRPNTVRVIYEANYVPEMPRLESDPKRDEVIEFNPSQNAIITGTGDDITVQTKDGNGEKTGPVEGRLPMIVDIESETAALMTIQLPQVKNPTFTKPAPDVLEVRLPGVQMTLPDDFKLATDAVANARARIEGSDTFLTLYLVRPMGAEVWADEDGVQIQLLKPAIGNGQLAGKVIVVDPGHGGKDRGANAGGVFEKDLNLTIGRLIAAELANQGATVIMTRKTDVFISLNERANIANRNNADIFISTHINSTGNSSKQSGTITFHHLGKGTSRVLAECIQEEIAKVNKLPDIGVWSDGRIYKNGFAVLRQTKMPGVLLELGFINNSRDRARLVQPDFHQAVAKAVVRGLKVYLGQ